MDLLRIINAAINREGAFDDLVGLVQIFSIGVIATTYLVHRLGVTVLGQGLIDPVNGMIEKDSKSFNSFTWLLDKYGAVHPWYVVIACASVATVAVYQLVPEMEGLHYIRLLLVTLIGAISLTVIITTACTLVARLIVRVSHRKAKPS